MIFLIWFRDMFWIELLFQIICCKTFSKNSDLTWTVLIDWGWSLGIPQWLWRPERTQGETGIYELDVKKFKYMIASVSLKPLICMHSQAKTLGQFIWARATTMESWTIVTHRIGSSFLEAWESKAILSNSMKLGITWNDVQPPDWHTRQFNSSWQHHLMWVGTSISPSPSACTDVWCCEKKMFDNVWYKYYKVHDFDEKHHLQHIPVIFHASRVS